MPTAESEPNNGNAVGEVNATTAPGAASGTIGTANDLDLFTVSLTAGQHWRWTVDGACGPTAPHLAVVEAANSVPILVARGAVNSRAVLDQLVLKTGSYTVIVRDSRNVPGASSQNVGSPSHGYLLAAEPSPRVPTAVAVPSTTQATLPDRFNASLFSFTLGASTPVTVRTNTSGSSLDTRLSLFSVTTSQWLGTNDDVSGATTDSLLTGTLPAGDYRVLVDNINESATTLAFELQLSSP